MNFNLVNQNNFIILKIKQVMAKFGLYTNQGERITITEHKDMKEALEFHAKRKQLPLDLFISMFRVEKIEENETRSIKN